MKKDLWVCKVAKGQYISKFYMDRDKSGYTDNINEAHRFDTELRINCVESATRYGATFIRVDE
jgi:hypothetical protein